MLEHLDLFSGIGGFREAVEQLGGRTVFWCENMPAARKVYQARHDTDAAELTPIEYACGLRGEWSDVRSLLEHVELPDHNLLTAGFPCQPFSPANVCRKADDPRRGLFSVIPEILKVCRPKLFLLENVPGLKAGENRSLFDSMLRDLEGAGYAVYCDVMDARPWVAQFRKRLWFVGFRQGVILKPFRFGDVVQPPEKYWPAVRDVLCKSVPAEYTLSDRMMAYMQRREDNPETGFGYMLPPLDGATGTILASYAKMGGRPSLIRQEGKNPRMLTETEVVRLMGLHSVQGLGGVSKLDRYRLLGNSVVVPQVMAILRTMLNCLMDPVCPSRGPR